MTMGSDTGTTPSGPDAGEIDLDQWPFREFPLGPEDRRTGFQAVLKRSVIEDMRHHGLDNPEVEVCGVLVGNVYRDHDGPYLHILAGIRGEYAGHDKAQVTFTAETWSYIQDEMDQNYPEERIVGWYHTHPGFGVFLSSMDLFIHHHFFNLPWQVAWVYDPFADEAGLYVWKDGRAVLERASIEEDPAVRTDYAVPRFCLESPPMTAGAPASPDLEARVARLETSSRRLKALLIVLAGLAVLWPILAVMIFSGPGAAPEKPAVPVHIGPATPSDAPVQSNIPRQGAGSLQIKEGTGRPDTPSLPEKPGPDKAKPL